MVQIRPFRALRPRPELAEQVASVPYDVVNTEEARALAQGNPLSFLHVVRPDIDLPEGTSPYADEVYTKARAALDRLVGDGVLIQEDRPSLYLYRQAMTLLGREVSQIGVVACAGVDDYNEDRIKKHERTRKVKEDDRTRHVLTLNANTGPVFLLHKPDPELDALVDRASADDPLYDFTAPDGVHHTVWRLQDPEALVQAFAKHPAVYVADGHHRSASAARAGAERRAADPHPSETAEYMGFLTVLFPANQLTILPYHRVVRSLGQRSPGDFLEALASVGTLERTEDAEPVSTGQIGVYLDGRWHRLTLPTLEGADAVDSLDYLRLTKEVLGPLLGIEDLRTAEGIDFVGGIRGTGELERRVDSGEMAVAFAMHPVTVEQLIAVADAGAIMPPKSTWFEPKLRSGLLIHSLD